MDISKLEVQIDTSKIDAATEALDPVLWRKRHKNADRWSQSVPRTAGKPVLTQPPLDYRMPRH